MADSSRIDEFMSVYASGELTEDERFTLMETIIQSFEDTCAPSAHPQWSHLLDLLNENAYLHMPSIRYWAVLDDAEDGWLVTPAMRKLLVKP